MSESPPLHLGFISSYFYHSEAYSVVRARANPNFAKKEKNAFIIIYNKSFNLSKKNSIKINIRSKKTQRVVLAQVHWYRPFSRNLTQRLNHRLRPIDIHIE